MSRQSLTEYRALARELLRVACLHADGRTPRAATDATYRCITEDRGRLERGSLDLATWLLYRLGVRCFWLLRHEHEGWARPPGTALEDWPVRRVPTEGDVYQAGDLLCLGTSPSEIVAIVYETDGAVVRTAEYYPDGAEIAQRLRHHHFGAPYLGGIKITGWVPLEVALDHADAGSELAPPDDAALDQLCDTRH